MQNKNYVFIAKSLDGYIADKDGGIDYLYSVPNPDSVDMGYSALTEKIDAIVMGRATFEKVLSFAQNCCGSSAPFHSQPVASRQDMSPVDA